MATKKRGITDEEVEAEIERLNQSPYVELARAEQRRAYRRRQYMYQLRWYENRGRELENAGITLETLNKTDEIDLT